MTDRAPSVLVSILSWDSPRYLANLLDNLDGLPPSVGGRTSVHLHVLDQGSDAETCELIRSFVARGGSRSAAFLPGNIGFGRGHNRVFERVYRQTRFDYFVMVNQDVLFGHPGWVDQLVEGMADPAVAIGGPVVWQLCDRPGVLLETSPQPDVERIFSIQGSVAIVRTDAVERFGLFDAAYSPAYFEDTDLCRRYVHAGLKLAWIPIAQVHAYLGGQEKLIRRKAEALRAEYGDFHARNRALFRRRWMAETAPAVTEETLERLWPGVYRPKRPERRADGESPASS